jgi:hypothetical protein
MCDIYSSCGIGLIWLGEDENATADDLMALELLYEAAQRDTDDSRTFKETVWPKW